MEKPGATGEKWFNRRKHYAVNSLVSLIFVLLLIIIVNVIASIHDFRIDVTSSGSFSLSSQTLKILTSLQKDFKLIGFFNPDLSTTRKHLDLLEMYEHRSKHIAIEIVDPYRSPLKAKQYNVEKIQTLVVEYGNRNRKVTPITEANITGAMKNLIYNKTRIVCFTVGHGEHSIFSADETGYITANDAMKKENYSTRPVLLLKEDRIPENCTVLVIAGPQKPFLDHEIRAISRFIESSGATMILLEPLTGSKLAGLVRRYNISVRNDIIVDKVSALRGGDYTVPVVKFYGKHPITEGFTLETFFPVARSVDAIKPQIPKEPNKTMISATSLARASMHSWGETEIRGDNSIHLDFNSAVDTPGPVSVATVAERGGAKPLRLVVFGDASFASNKHFALAGNGDLFLNSINWLSEEDELIAIRPRENVNIPLILTRRQGITLWCIYVGALFLTFFAGILFYFYRKKLQ